MGLHRAGFDVTGVDIKPQPRYPFRFIQADAMTFPLDGYDFIWASPPCQAYSWSSARWRRSGEREYPDLIDATRDRLIAAGVPYVIENVVGARRKMRRPITLCGQSFGLGVVRHRLFESDFFLMAPSHVGCVGAVTRDLVSVTGHGAPGRWYRAVTVAGHGGNSKQFSLSIWKEAMDIDWMTRDELTQSIPPAYSEFIGKQAIQYLESTERSPDAGD